MGKDQCVGLACGGADAESVLFSLYQRHPAQFYGLTQARGKAGKTASLVCPNLGSRSAPFLSQHLICSIFISIVFGGCSCGPLHTKWATSCANAPRCGRSSEGVSSFSHEIALDPHVTSGRMIPSWPLFPKAPAGGICHAVRGPEGG